jgi:hypothetical protein
MAYVTMHASSLKPHTGSLEADVSKALSDMRCQVGRPSLSNSECLRARLHGADMHLT